MTKFNYKQRRAQLIQNGSNAEQIRTTIHKEYGIYLSLADLEIAINKHKTLIQTPNQLSIKQLALRFILNTPPKITLHFLQNKLSEALQNQITTKSILEHLKPSIGREIQYDKKATTFQKIIRSQNPSTPHPSLDINIDIDLTDLINEISSIALDEALLVNTGISQLDDAIRNVVRDNKITTAEETYLLAKANEYQYKADILKLIRNATNQNNPYLDQTIQSIFDDGIITSTELIHLKDNAAQIGLMPEYLNKRFWTVSIAQHALHLCQNNNFIDLLKMTFYATTLSPIIKKTEILNLIRDNCDLYFDDDINQIFIHAKEKIQRQIAQFSGAHLTEIPSLVTAKYVFTNYPENRISIKSNQQEQFIQILLEEGARLGEPQANLLIENVIHRITRNK